MAWEACATDNIATIHIILQAITSYVIWGSNSAALTTFNGDLPDGFLFSQRLTQEWKTSLSNFNNQVQPLSMQFNLNRVTYSGTDVSHFMLMIDNDGDGDFTTGTVQQVLATGYDNTSKVVSFDNINVLTEWSGVYSCYQRHLKQVHRC